ncbi:hypothetical protein E4U52_005264 [Claviceps spartinae]|nr:hypothetical protein E4U52_005264 [Claviceps spartinae]
MSVKAQLESDILPQLRRLRRNFMGSPNPELPVMPPRRFWDFAEKRVWPSMMKDTNDYVLCHTDLDRQNILVDPNTFKIVSILDWETAGFFPQEWELPLWTVQGQEQYRMAKEAHGREVTIYQTLPCPRDKEHSFRRQPLQESLRESQEMEREFRKHQRTFHKLELKIPIMYRYREHQLQEPDGALREIEEPQEEMTFQDLSTIPEK